MNNLKELPYNIIIEWTGNTGKGTKTYTAYERSYTIFAEKKPVLQGSSDYHFRGDASKYNPEEMLVTAASSCHMLWYLHICAVNDIIVTGYKDSASGVLTLNEDHSGKFTKIILNPVVTITNPDKIKQAQELHAEAGKFCFIANSLNFPIEYNPLTKTEKAFIE